MVVKQLSFSIYRDKQKVFLAGPKMFLNSVRDAGASEIEDDRDQTMLMTTKTKTTPTTPTSTTTTPTTMTTRYKTVKTNNNKNEMMTILANLKIGNNLDQKTEQMLIDDILNIVL
ncbi:hypothetical protein V1477_016501 [Vespula maculifrons]|uniref:Uncharacterized protein n=1 Tax=Vespula maculifrons TaxID=7453 RepID=A0ABD2B9B7_VESMC